MKSDGWIVSELKGPNNTYLVAAGAPDGGVVIAVRDPADRNQAWIPLPEFTGGVQIRFFNVGLKKYLSAPTDDSATCLSEDPDLSTLWSVQAWGSDLSLRAFRNVNVALDVTDSHTSPGTPILAFGWTGGHDNQIWDVYAVSDQPG